MDLEAIQLLNLSPIPELSEIELSTMLEQLSGLSDINGDVTDRNVEDILREAEDLLDKSIGSKTNETVSLEKSPEELSNSIAKNMTSVNEQGIQQSDKTKQSTDTPCDYVASHNSSNEDSRNKHYNTPIESPQSKVYSPGGSINHIKSTIDSLKEFSTLIEKKFNSQSESTSPSVKTARNSKDESEETTAPNNQSIVSSNQVTINPKIIKDETTKESKTQNETTKEPKTQNETTKEAKSLNKSIKLLNCFERLYQVRPVRLSTNKKPKVIDKPIKTIPKKKFSKDTKASKRSSQQGKTEKTVPSIEEDILKQDTRLKQFCSKNSSEFVPEDKTGQIQLIDEKLIMKVLEKMDEMKNHARKVDLNQNQNEGTDRSKLEVVALDRGQNSGIQRLEQQFSVLKEKYDHQIDKLEAENQRLREILTSQRFTAVVPEILRVDVQQQTDDTGERRKSFESCKTCHISPLSFQKDLKEAFSQTDEINDAQEVETKKNDDKENFGGKKKPPKCKPFADANVRQKKSFDYETQLLATVRGLQAEVATKDKENKKLKNEIESLRKQMKKLTGSRVENWKKYNVGTQTIGFGSIAMKPYNPEEYEAREDFEKENEDLRTRIKALEEDFELLKEKRISDLQALHQVHEEEMGKLVSKLETQSALTRHLHSLLIKG